jgi:hypothetical protein
MNGVLRSDLDEREPTPGAGPCLDDLGLFDEDSLADLWGQVKDREWDYLEVLFYRDDEREAWALVRVGEECLRLIEVAVALCGEGSSRFFEFADLPEVVKIDFIQRSNVECVIFHSSSDPPARAIRFLEQIGMRGPFKVLGYSPAEVEGLA